MVEGNIVEYIEKCRDNYRTIIDDYDIRQKDYLDRGMNGYIPKTPAESVAFAEDAALYQLSLLLEDGSIESQELLSRLEDKKKELEEGGNKDFDAELRLQTQIGVLSSFLHREASNADGKVEVAHKK